MDARERFDLLVGRSQLLCKLTNFRVQRLVLLLRAREEQSAIPRAERVRDHAERAQHGQQRCVSACARACVRECVSACASV
eukprot:3874419-Pleurochrysis_carterae.AAC.1